MTYVTEFTVLFGEIDQAGVVYYPRFFHYFHQTFERWFGEALGVPYSTVVTDENLGFPSVRVDTEFVKPLRYGDRFKVELTLADVGDRSITVQYRVTRLPDGEHVAQATVKKAAIRSDAFRSVPIPQEWRDRFERFRSG